MVKVNGSMRASVVGAEMPGRIPIMNPTRMPIIITENDVQVNVWARPDSAAGSRVSMYHVPADGGAGAPRGAPPAPPTGLYTSAVHRRELRLTAVVLPLYYSALSYRR
jgi:hypothetical protein